MKSMNQLFPVVTKPMQPVGSYTHFVKSCPRCGSAIGINTGMLAGVESIICKGHFGDGRICNGHYYLRGAQLEFVGTV